MSFIWNCCLCECLEWLLCPPIKEGKVSDIRSKKTIKKVYGAGIEQGVTGKVAYEALGAYIPSYKININEEIWHY